MVESGMYDKAYNAKEKATGIAQVRPIRLKDFNKSTGKNYKLSDMYDINKSKEVFMYYVSYNLEETIRCWNGGPDAMKKRSTLKYYEKVLKYL